jgi:hypothetical protein
MKDISNLNELLNKVPLIGELDEELRSSLLVALGAYLLSKDNKTRNAILAPLVILLVNHIIKERKENE